MKQRIHFIIALLCISDAVLASNDTLAPAPYKAIEPVALMYKFAPDESVRYVIAQKIIGTQTTPGQNTKNIDAELSTVVKITYVRLYDDGTIDLSVKVESATMKLDGKSVDGYTPPKDVFLVPFAITGVINLANMNFGSIESMPFMLVLPGKKIGPGAAWMLEIPLKNQLLTMVRLDYIFDSIKNKKVLIKQKITTSTKEKKVKDKSPSPNLQEGSADIVFDMDTGKLISSKGMIRSSITEITGKVSLKDKIIDDKLLSITKLDCSFSVGILDNQAKQTN